MTTDNVWLDAERITLATLGARERMRDHSIGTEVHRGQYRIVSMSYVRGRSRAIVTPLTAYLPFHEVLDVLESMDRDD